MKKIIALLSFALSTACVDAAAVTNEIVIMRHDGTLTVPQVALKTDIPTEMAWSNVTNKPTFKSFTTNEAAKISASDIATGVIPTISATDPTFSNAVLSVGLNIDTNSVAVLNEIAATFGGFPIAGSTTTVGGLLAALAAAVAWLRKKKIDKITCSGVSDITTENGTANVSTLFSSEDTSTDPQPSGLLKNSALDIGIVKVTNSIVGVPNATLEAALGTAAS